MKILKTIFEKTRIKRGLPVNIQNRDLPYFEKLLSYDCPPLYIYIFKSINLLPDGTLFKWIFPLDISFPFYKKRLKHHNFKGVLSIIVLWKKIKLKSKSSYLIIHDPWTSNYYHWLTQAIPRLLLAKQTNIPFTLLLPESHGTDFHISTLKILGINEWETLKGNNNFYKIHNLIYPTHDIQIGDYNDESIRLVRTTFNKMHLVNQPYRKIFIRRTDQTKRRILNEVAVLAIFRKHNFEIVEFESLTFQSQLQIMAQTKVLVGVHGAGLTNMIFMSPQSSVLELTSRINGEHYYYYSLGSACLHKYYYQVCSANESSEVQEANLSVDINELERNISLILSNA